MPLVLHDSLTPVIIETFCGKTVDADANVMGDAALVIQWEKNGGRNQQWYLDRCGAEEFRIIGRLHGRVLDAGGPPGTHVYVHAWADNANQRWVFEDAGDGKVNICLAANRQLCLDVGWASRDNGGQIHIWHRDGAEHQKFKLLR